LYLYIYIVPLVVHTNQKRFQCERPREKRDFVLGRSAFIPDISIVPLLVRYYSEALPTTALILWGS